jgi:hypothetical protein
VAVRYAFIERHQTDWPVATQCRVLDVSASGYRHIERARRRKPVRFSPVAGAVTRLFWFTSGRLSMK